MSGIPDQKSDLPPFANLRTNAILDTAERDKRRRNQSSSLYKGSVDGDGVFDACQGEITLRKKPTRAGRGYGAAMPTNYTAGLTVLNGGGSENGYHEFMNQHQFLGLVATQAKLREDGGHSADTFPVDMHGTATTFNNGKEMIVAGSYVMWNAPRNAEEAAQMTNMKYNVRGRPRGRILAYFQPYDPIEHSFSRERMQALRALVANNNDSRHDPSAASYRGLHCCVRKFMALGALLQQYATSRGNVAFTLNGMFDATTTSGIAERTFNDFGLSNTPSNNSLNKVVLSLTDRLVAFSHGDRLPTAKTNSMQKLAEMIKNTVHETARYYKRLDSEIRQRVIGMALSTAATGQRFDIFLSQPPC